LKEASFDEMRRIIREEEPPKPSMRISTLDQAATTISTQRQSEPKRLSQLLHGELDWIVMKALEKDRNRRYETASAFAADVQHYLHDEPVQACPPSAWYRLGKFTRRHRMGLALTACVLALVLGLAGSGVWFAQQRAAGLAETKRTVTAALAQAEAAAARVRVSRLREALLSALAEWAGFTPDDRERQQVERVYDLAVPLGSLWAQLAAAMKRRDHNELVRLAQEPSIQDLPPKRISLAAKNLAALKEWATAEQLLRAGLERKPGDFWLNQELGLLLLDQQPPRPEEAVRYLTAALALRPDSPGAHLNLGIALRRTGDVAGALQHYRAALRINCRCHRNS
jgi:tetratricopeptide (TPR) repeat protein